MNFVFMSSCDSINRGLTLVKLGNVSYYIYLWFVVITDLFLSYCVADAPADDRNVIHPAQVHHDLKNAGYTW